MDHYESFKNKLNDFYKEYVNDEVDNAFKDVYKESIIPMIDDVIGSGEKGHIVEDCQSVMKQFTENGFVNWVTMFEEHS